MMFKWVSMLLDVLAPSRVEVRSLKARNDTLVQQNNRLGKRILDLSDRNSRGRKRSNGGQAAQAETKYKTHVEAQRQNIVVQELRRLVSVEQFEGICDMANDLTDEQVLAHAEALKRTLRPAK